MMIDPYSLRHNWFPKAVDLDSLWKAFFWPHINEQQTWEEMHSCKLLVTRKHMICVSLSNAYIDMYASQRGKQRESLREVEA